MYIHTVSLLDSHVASALKQCPQHCLSVGAGPGHGQGGWLQDRIEEQARSWGRLLSSESLAGLKRRKDVWGASVPKLKVGLCTRRRRWVG